MNKVIGRIIGDAIKVDYDVIEDNYNTLVSEAINELNTSSSIKILLNNHFIDPITNIIYSYVYGGPLGILNKLIIAELLKFSNCAPTSHIHNEWAIKKNDGPEIRCIFKNIVVSDTSIVCSHILFSHLVFIIEIVFKNDKIRYIKLLDKYNKHYLIVYDIYESNVYEYVYNSYELKNIITESSYYDKMKYLKDKLY